MPLRSARRSEMDQAGIVSIIDDCAQHLGQAAYLRGIAP